MSKEFIFPDLGEGITEGELVKWLVKVGDSVQEDQDVAEVETDKALVNIPSPIAGVVEKLNFKEGDPVPVGSVLMTFVEGGDSTPKPDADKKVVEKTKAPETPEKKATPPKESTPKQAVPITTAAKANLPALATPFTRKIARELGVHLNSIQGTGPGGRITEADVRGAAQGKETGDLPAPTSLPVSRAREAGTPAKPTDVDFEKYGPVEKVPLKGIRRKISENMLQAWQQTVMVTHMDEAEVGELTKIRKEKAEFAKKRGVKLTLLPFLMKACVIALKEYPYLNASLTNDEIIIKNYYHFGFAVDTEAGLMVPVIRDVDKKSILHLASELVELSTQARERKIDMKNLKGNSFSLTNIGSIGGKAFTPIINYPDSAILGLGRTYEKPVVRDGEITSSMILPLCLTFDHRTTDGATAARFVNRVIELLKDPDLLLLEDGED